MNRRFGPLLLLTSAGVLACSGSDAGSSSAWTGEVQDSAGVPIVLNAETGLWPGGREWSVETELMIGTVGDDPEREFGLIRGIAVGSDGSMFVLDQQSLDIRVFDSTGALKGRFARAGQGPGELGAVVGDILNAPGDTLLVPDPINRRTNVYLPNGDALPARPFGWEGSFLGEAGLSNGELVVRTFSNEWDGLLLAGRGQVVDTLHRFIYPEPDVQVRGTPGTSSFRATADPLMVLPLWAVLTDGRIAVATTESFSILILEADGSLERRVSFARSRKPITAGDQEALRGRWRERQASQGIPEEVAASIELAFPDSFPAFASLAGGPEGTLWIQHLADVSEMDPAGLGGFSYEELGSRTWSVLDAEGRFLGDVVLPYKVRMLQAHDQWLYGVARGELDEDQLVRLRIRRPRAGG